MSASFDLLRRGVSLASEAAGLPPGIVPYSSQFQPPPHSGDSTPDSRSIPTLVAVSLATIVMLGLVAHLLAVYILGVVVSNLTLVEDPSAEPSTHSPLKMPGSGSDDQHDDNADRKLAAEAELEAFLSSKPPLEPLSPPKPITRSLRRTLQHILYNRHLPASQQTRTRRSLFRGLRLSLLYSLAYVLVFTLVRTILRAISPALKPMDFVTVAASHLLATPLTLRLAITAQHATIADAPAGTGLRARIVARDVARPLMGVAMRAVLTDIMHQGGLVGLSECYQMRRAALRTGGVGDGRTVVLENLAFLLAMAVWSLACYGALVIPAAIARDRAFAAVVPPAEEGWVTVVPVRRGVEVARWGMWRASKGVCGRVVRMQIKIVGVYLAIGASVTACLTAVLLGVVRAG